jgi:Flp pilus assembly protein TadD
VVELKPDSALAWAALGTVLLAAGRRAEAETAFHRAQALEPGNATAEAGLRALHGLDQPQR